MSTKVHQFLTENNFTETEPRPPVLGEENDRTSNGGGSTRSSGSQRSTTSTRSCTTSTTVCGDSSLLGHSPCATPRRSNLADKHNVTSSAAADDVTCFKHPNALAADSFIVKEAPLGFEPEGSAANSPQFTENSSTPAYLKWAENIEYLLDDNNGVKLFTEFLKKELCVTPLDFWFACNGLKNSEPGLMTLIIKRIYKNYIRDDALYIKPEYKRAIIQKIKDEKRGLDNTIFDAVQQEVWEKIRAEMYPLFLKSDIYLNYVQNGGRSPKSAAAAAADASLRQQGPLPALPEGELLDLSSTSAPSLNSTLELTQIALHATQALRNSSNPVFKRPEMVYATSSSRMPSNPYHHHTSYTTVSAQDSEPSLSSDALTDDTMSATDSSIDGRSQDPPYGSKAWRRQKRAQRQPHVNDYSRTGLNLGQPLIPRTARQLAKDSRLAQEKPEIFAKIVIQKLEEVQAQREKLQASRERDEANMERMLGSMQKCEFGDTLNSLTLLGNQEAEAHDAQAILENHCTRIGWNNSSGQTPVTESPGRTQSPDRGAGFHAWSGPAPLRGPNTSMNTSMNLSLNKSLGSSSRRAKDGAGFVTSHSYDGLSDLSSEPPPPMRSSSHHEQLFSRSFAHYNSSGRVAAGGAAAYNALSRSMHEASSRYHMDPASSHPPARNQPAADGWERKSRDRRVNSKKIDNNNLDTSGVFPTGLNNSAADDKVLAWVTANASSSASKQRGPPPTTPRMPPSAVVAPLQPIMQDPQLPILNPPHTTTQLEETKRRLEFEQLRDGHAQLVRGADGRALPPPPQQAPPPLPPRVPIRPAHMNLDQSLSSDEQSCGGSLRNDGQRRSSSKPRSTPSTPMTSSESTVVGYFFCGEKIPYRTHYPGKNITLGQFKALISKKGSFRYYFKTASDEFGTAGVVQEEVSDDNQVLPLWDGKVVATVEKTE